MASFLYYLPGGKGALNGKMYQEQLDAFGIGDVLRGASPGSMRNVDQGPDGSKGVIFSPEMENVEAATVGYYPEKQKWAKRGACWVGCYKDDMPGQEDLQRDSRLETYPVSMGDGGIWKIPVALYFGGNNALPLVYGIDTDGNPGRIVDNRYDRLTELATPISEYVSGVYDNDPSGGLIYSNSDLFDVICEALGHTYYIGETEIRLLGLVRDDLLWTALNAILGISTTVDIMRAQDDAVKKKDGV